MFYEAKAPAWPAKSFLAANHLFAILAAAWLMFGGGIELVSRTLEFHFQTGDFVRRIMLISCSTVYFLRLLITGLVFLKRKVSWTEAVGISILLYLLHITFAVAGGSETRPVGLNAGLGALLYAAGSYLNTASEYARYMWKKQPKNRGRLYTQGLFKHSMHINYFGDIALFTGFALITRRAYALLVPAIMAMNFLLVMIPMLDSYLEKTYGKDFEEYARRTKKLIPMLY